MNRLRTRQISAKLPARFCRPLLFRVAKPARRRLMVQRPNVMPITAGSVDFQPLLDLNGNFASVR
jgi:hypothetical protein